MRLDLVFGANDQVVKLVERLFHEILFEREISNVFHDIFHECAGVSSDYELGAFSWLLSFKKVDF